MTCTTRAAEIVCILMALSGSVIARGIEAEPVAPAPSPVWVEPGLVETAVLYADGQEVQVQIETVTRLVCGSNTQGVTQDDVRALADLARERFADGQPTWQISAEGVRGGLNVVFNVSGGLPAGAQAALDAVALYIESQFTDPLTVTVNFSMAPMGDGILGGTSSSFVTGTSYTNTRNGLVNGMDADDTIQTWLPTGSSIPVRYDASTSTITNESVIRFTRANYNATIGSSAGSAASITLNTNFSWDYDPSNGITTGTYCYQSVLAHEVGHALGFISRVDAQVPDMDALDLYRFQRTDGTGTDWNPDDLAEFQTTARTVDFNNLNDDANSDIISAEYRMSDGNPWQASHFREQSPNIGIMDPSMGFNSTFYPDFFRASDLNMFDGIGWDRVVCAPLVFDNQPVDQFLIQGQPAEFAVRVSGTGPFTYQWRKDGVNLVDGPAAGGGTISGATTDTLSLSAVDAPDEGGYDCVVVSACGFQTSDTATLTVCVPAVILDDPDSQTVDEGQPVSFSVVPGGSGPFSYRWRRNNVVLADGPAPGGGTISGASTSTISITPVGELDEGTYDCIVGGECGTGNSAAATLTVEAGVPSAAITGALTRKSCDLPVTSFNGAGPIDSEPRQGGVTELRITFDLVPAGPGANPVVIEEATCAAPSYAAYSGSSVIGASIAGNELVVTFTPGLENARSYRLSIDSSVTSLPGQFVEIHGLVGDTNSDGLVNATDRSQVVGAWTGSGFTCSTDVNNDAVTNATDRSIVVGAWTGGADCAP